jgi:hypothetical protein
VIPPELLANHFTHHPPKGDQAVRYAEIRSRAGDLASFIVSVTPHSGEQALAVTKLEEAVMWANASIARNE